MACVDWTVKMMVALLIVLMLIVGHSAVVMFEVLKKHLRWLLTNRNQCSYSKNESLKPKLVKVHSVH